MMQHEWMHACICFSSGIVYPIEKKHYERLMENGVHSRGSGFVETNSTKGRRLPYITYLQQVSEARNLQKLRLIWAAQVGRPALPCNPSSRDGVSENQFQNISKSSPPKQSEKYIVYVDNFFFFLVYLFSHSIETGISNCLFPFTKYSESHNRKVFK